MVRQSDRAGPKSDFCFALHRAVSLQTQCHTERPFLSNQKQPKATNYDWLRLKILRCCRPLFSTQQAVKLSQTLGATHI